ncbi:thioesterase II family protein [Krasilnikovia sp. MM14-A1004]|uniref:thioesterase II family protein n=1 Tax=Krasilnikovia sp. MM14-A1004 TaxID=3373541 RepID=UPI00399D24B1
MTAAVTPAAPVRPDVVDAWAYRPYPLPEGTPRVFCFPHAGGDVTAYAALAAALAPDREVWAVRLPARGGRYTEAMPAGFDALVAAIVAGIGRHVRPDAVFYGQSLGALLGYEVARALPAGRRPSTVVAACAGAPDTWPGTVPADTLGAAALLHACGLEVDEAIRDLVVDTIRADLTVCRDYRYRPAPRPGFALHAVAAAGDPMIGSADVARWAIATTGPFSTSVEAGGHLLATPFSAGPAALLRRLGGSHDHDHD